MGEEALQLGPMGDVQVQQQLAKGRQWQSPGHVLCGCLPAICVYMCLSRVHRGQKRVLGTPLNRVADELATWVLGIKLGPLEEQPVP